MIAVSIPNSRPSAWDREVLDVFL